MGIEPSGNTNTPASKQHTLEETAASFKKGHSGKTSFPQKLFAGYKVTVSMGRRFLRHCKDTFISIVNFLSLGQRKSERYYANAPLSHGQFWKEVYLPDEPSELCGIAVDSAIAQLPYDMDESRLSQATLLDPDHPARDCQVDKKLFTLLINQRQPDTTEGLSGDLKARTDWPFLKGFKLSESGMLYDENTGLTAVLVQDRTSNKWTLAFGGTLSSYGVDNGVSKGCVTPVEKMRLVGQQVGADIVNFLGVQVPPCYNQAVALTSFLRDLLSSEKACSLLKIKEKGALSLAGHSLGGAVVQYAAVKTGISGKSFSPAALGKATLKALSGDEKKSAKEGLVKNYMVDGDPVNTPIGYKCSGLEFCIHERS